MAFTDDIGSTTQAPPPQSGSGIRDAIRALFPDDVGKKPEPNAPVDTGYAPGTYQSAAEQAAKARGVDPALLMALIHSESSWNPNAVSPTGVRGIAQFTKSTARQYGVNPNDPISSINGAAHYLSDLLRDTRGDSAEAIRRYKGVSAGGATEEDVQKTLALVPRYQSGYAPQTNYTAPAPGRDSEQPKPFDTSDPHMFDGVDTSDPNFFSKKQQSDVPVEEIGGLFGELVQAQRQSNAGDASAVQGSAQAQQNAEGVALGGRLRDIAGDLGGPSHIPVGELAQAAPPPAPRSPYDIPPVSDPAAISRGKDRGLEKMSDFDKRVAESPFWNGVKASLDMMGAAGVASPQPAFRASLQFANALLANIPSSILPQTFNAATEATSTGSPAADFVTDVVAQGAGMMITAGGATTLAGKLTGAEGIVKAAVGFEAYAAPSQAIALGKGESLGKVAAKVPITLAEGALFHKAGAIDNLLGRVAGSAATSAGASAADQLVENGSVDGKELVKSAGVGAVYGILGGGGGHDEATAVKERVDQAAHEAATSPLNDVPPPTEPQKAAGNYKMGHVSVQGLDISIENPAGSVRSGETRDGTPWSTTMQDHYGYIKGTKGADGDHVDAFLGPDLTSEKVFVVDQSKRGVDGKPFDEHKVVLGASSLDEAREIYTRNYDNNPEERILSLTETTMPEFKQWLKEGDTAKPFAGEVKSEEPAAAEAQPEPEAPGLTINRKFTPGRQSAAKLAAMSPEERAAALEPARIASIDKGVKAIAAAIDDGTIDVKDGLARIKGLNGSRYQPPQPDEALDRQPIPLAQMGNETTLRVGDAKKTVRYALVESDQIRTSHDPFTFAKDEAYPGENQNPYHSDTAQQASVQRMGADFDYAIYHSRTTNATEGPTIIDPYGNAAGGNARGMSRKIDERMNPERAKDQVVRDAREFGLDPAIAAKMEHPAIVRVQPDEVSTSIESRRDIAAQNLSVTKSRRPADEGVNLASRLTEENKSMLASTLGDVDSFTELTKSAEKAKPIIKILRDAGQITATNANEYITPDATLTPKGRETVEGMTLGLALPSGDLAQRLPDGYRQKLAENLRPLGAVEAEKGWELHGNLERVLNFVEARKAFIEKGGPKEMFDRQTSLLDDAEKPPPLTDEDRLLLNLLDDPKRTKFKEFMASYASKAAEARAGDVMLGEEPMTRERAFAEANAARGGAEPVPHKPLAKVIDKLNETKYADDEVIRRAFGGIQERQSLIDEPKFVVVPSDKFKDLESADRFRERQQEKNRAKEPFVPAEARQKGPPRGAQAIIDRLAMERRMKKTGDPTVERAVGDFMSRLGEPLFDDLGLSIRRARGGAEGQFDYGNRIVTLFQRTATDVGLGRMLGYAPGSSLRTMVHELWHTLSRYVSDEDVAAMRKQYEAERDRFLAKNEWAYDIVNNKELNPLAAKQWRAKYPEHALHLQIDPATGVGRTRHSAATYRYTHFDEWWAETMADKTLPPHVEPTSVVGRIVMHAKNILRAMGEAIQRAFGYNRASKLFIDFASGEMAYADRERLSGFGDPNSSFYGGRSDIQLSEERVKEPDDEAMRAIGRRGAAKIAEGLSDFAAWSKSMLDEYGPGIREHLAEIFARSKQIELVGRGEGIGTSVKELRDAYANPPKHSDAKRAFGIYEGEKQIVRGKLNRLARDINSRFSKQTQIGITHYLQAGGDEALLHDWQSKSEEKYKQDYGAALSLTPEEKAFADDVRHRLDQLWSDAHEAGILHSYVANYVRGEWSKAPEDVQRDLVNRITSGEFNTNPMEMRRKVFLSYFDGEQAGYTPKDKSIGRQLVAAEESLRLAIAARKALASLTEAKAADGRPVLTILGEAHLAESVWDEAAGKDPSKQPWVVRPSAKDEGTGDYAYINHPALRKWKWVGDITHEDGKKQSILMHGDMWVHPDELSRFNAIFGRSRVRGQIKKSVPLIGGMRPGVIAQKISGEIKGTILIGPFHQIGLARHRLERLEPLTAPPINFDDPKVQEGAAHGLMMVNHSALEQFNDAARGRGLWAHLPGVSKVFLRYQNYLFQDLIPRWIADSYLREVPRFEQRYAADIASGKISRDQMLDIVAKQVNTAFGETNLEYIGSVFSNKTYRDVLGLVALAPKFLEQRGKFIAQALRPYGAEQRWALLRDAAMMAATAQTINYLLNDEMDWSHPFTFVYNGREYGLRGNITDAWHAVTDPNSFIMHRLNPAYTLPIYAGATGRDINDNKIDAAGVATEMLKTWTPIPMQGMWKGYLSEGAMNAVVNGLMQSAGVSNYQYRTGGEKFVFDKAYSKLDLPAKTPEDIFGILPVPAEQKKQTMKKDLREELRTAYSRQASSDEIGAIVKKYPKLTHEDIARQSGLAKHTPFQDAANNLSAKEMAEAFDKHLNDKERELLKPMFLRKLRTANPNPDLGGVSNEDKAKYREKYGLVTAR